MSSSSIPNYRPMHSAAQPASQQAGRAGAPNPFAPPSGRAPRPTRPAPGPQPSAPSHAPSTDQARQLRASLLAAEALLCRADHGPIGDAVGLPCGNICDRAEAALKESFRNAFLARAERNPERKEDLLESARQVYRCDCCREEITQPAASLESQPINAYLERARVAFPNGVAQASDAEVVRFAEGLRRVGQAIPTERPKAYVAPRMLPELLCPRTGKPFRDPVLARDGRVYERSALSATELAGAFACPLMQRLVKACAEAQLCSQSEVEVALARVLGSEADGAPLFSPGSLASAPTQTIDLGRAVIDASAPIRDLHGRENVTLGELASLLHSLPHVQRALIPALSRCDFDAADPMRPQGVHTWEQAFQDHAVLGATWSAHTLDAEVFRKGLDAFMGLHPTHHGTCFALLHATHGDTIPSQPDLLAANFVQGALDDLPADLCTTAAGFAALHPDKVAVVMGVHLGTLHMQAGMYYRSHRRDFAERHLESNRSVARACVDHLRRLHAEYGPKAHLVRALAACLEPPSELVRGVEEALQWQRESSRRGDTSASVAQSVDICDMAAYALLGPVECDILQRKNKRGAEMEACVRQLNQLARMCPAAAGNLGAAATDLQQRFVAMQRKAKKDNWPFG